MTYNINSPVTLLNSPSNCTRLYMTHKSPTLTTLLPMNYPIPRTFSHDYSTPPTPCTSPHYYHTTHIPSNPYHLPLIGCVTQSNFFYKLDFIDELMYDIKIYNTVLLCYNLHWSLLTSQFLSDFYPIPDLYAKIPPSYANIFIFIFHCAGNIHIWVSILCLRYVVNDISCGMRRLGRRAGERWWRFFLRECACKIILARNLFRQSKAQYRVPFRLPVPQGTRKEISADNSGVRPCEHDYYPEIDPTTYV